MEGNPQSASTLLNHDIQPGEQMTFGSYPHFISPMERFSRSYGGFSKIRAMSCSC
ncbi:hypothetical protein C812_02838 [Paenibacillus barengoltzii G22]|uniref:Uncharacterized protein n=1 Tax=Paenibacillus barengoltzii G22 TaxID=1235795 RepID=R9LBG3_9BACL|nr:hypothetical protein C812_02838 [Paenibacillus barengoltzii G22]